jgi:hypothetical protein
VFEFDFDEIARCIGKTLANTRQILTRARSRLRDSRPRFTASRRQSEEIVRHFRHACVTGNVQELMAVLHADATLVSDGGGKAVAASRPVLGAERIAKCMLGYAAKLHWSESHFQLVTVNGTAGLLLRHPIAGDGTYSFDIVGGRIRAIYVMRTMGVESPERVVFGTALAVCIFFMTWLCSRAKNRLVSIGALSALGLLVAALTVVRIDENTGEGGTSAMGWATALIMMAVTIGPAVIRHIA